MSAIITVDLAKPHIDAIRGLADELETVDQGHPAFDDVPLWSDVLINSGGDRGWMVAVDRWWGLMGRADDLQRLCTSLVAVGRKREREIAGRIKTRARYRDGGRGRGPVDTSTWLGEPPVRKPSEPKSIQDIAAAWKVGKSLKSGNIRTDGQRIYSWNLCIGETVSGRKVAIDYRQRVSMSTSRHCGAVITVAHRVRQPNQNRK